MTEDKTEAESTHVFNNIPQQFNEQGIAESTTRRSDEFLQELYALARKHELQLRVKRALKTETTQTGGPKDAEFHIGFVGEHLEINTQVPPRDRFGNDGRTWLPREEMEELRKRIKEEDPDTELPPIVTTDEALEEMRKQQALAEAEALADKAEE